MDDAASLAHAANDVLNKYIAVHDAVFGASLWKNIRRILPIPGIFEAIPYARHAETLSQLQQGLRRVETAAADAGRSVAGGSAQLQFLKELVEYCRALGDTVAKLHAICVGLAVKADAAGGPTLGEYKESLNDYEKSRVLYVAAGARLNSAYSSFQHAG